MESRSCSWRLFALCVHCSRTTAGESPLALWRKFDEGFGRNLPKYDIRVKHDGNTQSDLPWFGVSVYMSVDSLFWRFWAENILFVNVPCKSLVGRSSYQFLHQFPWYLCLIWYAAGYHFIRSSCFRDPFFTELDPLTYYVQHPKKQTSTLKTQIWRHKILGHTICPNRFSSGGV